MPKTEVKKIITQKIREAIKKDPYKKNFYKVSLFGSYASGKPNQKSDVDVLIEFTPKAKIGLFELVEIQENMKKFVEKKIDLVTKNGLDKYIKKEILSNAQTIYQKR